MNVTATRIRGIDTHHYLAKDLQRAIAFYRDVLRLTPSETASWDHGTEFELGDGSTFGVFRMPNDAWYPCGGVVFAVEDIKAMAGRLEESGVHFYTHGVMETPACWIAWCEDPEGNNFAVHQRK